MTKEDHSNDKSSDEDTQNGQCDLDIHDVLLFGSSLLTSMESSPLTSKSINWEGPYVC